MKIGVHPLWDVKQGSGASIYVNNIQIRQMALWLLHLLRKPNIAWFLVFW